MNTANDKADDLRLARALRARDGAFKLAAALLALAIVLGSALIHRWQQPGDASAPPIMRLSTLDRNFIAENYPNVDFRPMYPELSAEDIDVLQRESFAVRYVYSPFVQFQGLATTGRFVTIHPDGRRERSQPQPWPPKESDFTVFAFGGSTTFGNNLPPDQTVPAFIEQELKLIMPGTNVVVYNFGCGYYYSSQERALFNRLLEQGWKPDLALFIDGLNEFVNYSPYPAYTHNLMALSAPDIEFPGAPALDNEPARQAATVHVLQRYLNNLRSIMGAANSHGVRTIFIGQPVPHWGIFREPANYPYEHRLPPHDLAHFGYPYFAQQAARGDFGPNFIWAADAFGQQPGIMYSDAVHYSPEGARHLAKLLVERAAARGLLGR